MTLTKSEQPADKLVAARISLLSSHPFFGSLALRLIVQETRAIPTMATDGRNLWFNPQFVAALPFEQLKAVVAHEILHCALSHNTRFGKRDHDTWNQAADYAINPLIRDAGFELPPDGLLDEEFVGKAAEEIYGILVSRKGNPSDGQHGQGQGTGSGQSGQGRAQGQGQSSGQPQHGKGGAGGKGEAPSGQQKTGGATGSEKKHEDQAKDQGQGKGNANRPEPEPAKDFGSCGSFQAPANENGQPASASEIEEQEREWKVATMQAAAVAKRAGNLSGMLQETVIGLRKPKVDWRAQLRRFIDSSTRQNYSWLPPNRRYIQDGNYLPSVVNDGLGEIVFAIDTSGSMDSVALAMAVDELNSILKDLDPERVHVIQCDVKVQDVQEYSSGDYPIKVDAKNRGGTSFRPVFAKVAEMTIQPVCMIYFTDLEPSDGFPEEPDYPVLWTTPPATYSKAPWGEQIKVLADGE